MADPRPLLDSYSLYIDGRWVDPESGRYDDISPATEAAIAKAPNASLADVDAAISAARRATLAAGGQRPPGLDKGFYLEPTILTEVTRTHPSPRRKCSGPC
jgi:acyl-CoA reductase-like NAD-dependent aldehyde dehydrogenase